VDAEKADLLDLADLMRGSSPHAPADCSPKAEVDEDRLPPRREKLTGGGKTRASRARENGERRRPEL